MGLGCHRSPQAAGLTGAGRSSLFRRGWREFLVFRRARLRGRSNIVGKRDLREGLLKGDLNNSEEKALRSCLPKRGVCGHRNARDGAVPVPSDTGCILSETAGRRWKGERKQPGSKCYSRSVLSCWSWTSERSISLAQVRAQHTDVWESQWARGRSLEEEDLTAGKERFCDVLLSPETVLRLTWTFS